MAEKVDILVVDDDDTLRSKVVRYLSQEGYSVIDAASGEAMRSQLTDYKPSLVVLDLHLPDAHGLDLAKELREDPVIGIIIVTGSDDDFDKVVGLELGADDYLNKPADPRELLARIRSVLRRVELESQVSSADDDDTVTSFAHLRLDRTAHRLTDEEGNEIRLTSHEYQMFEHLIDNPNRVLSRDQLMNHISGRDWDPSDRSVDTLIAKVRKKVERNPSRPTLIQTVRGTGYMFTARTRQISLES